MALTAQAVLDRVSRSLNDETYTRWTQAELLEYLSDAQRAAVLVRPEVNPVTATLQLAAGTKQDIPDEGFVLIDVVRNLGTDGSIPGRAITPVDRAALDQTNPNWHAGPPDATVINFVYDIRNRRTFYVSPPQPDTGRNRVEIVHARSPEEITATSDDLGVDDIYIPALVAYVLHRAYIKDISVEGQGAQRSGAYYEMFMQLLLGKAEEQDADLTIRHETVEAGRG